MLRFVLRGGNADKEKAKKLAEELEISPKVAELLLLRGINDEMEAYAFLHPSVSGLEDPFLLKDMDKAVARIRRAVENNEKIIVFGDYDADGVCATAIMLSCLKKLGADADYIIPSRHEEGYGMSLSSVKQLYQAGARLVITVDNGVKSAEEIKECYELGIDVIVTDHHIPGDVVPRCEALILADNDDDYPNRKICGAGLAQKVAEALLGREKALEYIPLAGIASVADIVPLVGENRVFAAIAVEMIRKGQCPAGISALCIASQTTQSEINAGDFGFRIGPRLNAASRMEDAGIALELLREEDKTKALELAKRLDGLNARRKAEEDDIFASACKKLEDVDLTKRRSIVLHSENWNAGVIGIAAAKIAERFYRPTVLLTGAGTVVGSCRSISGVNIHDALNACEHYFARFGGHAYAAGLTMCQDDIEDFYNEFDRYFWQNQTEEMFVPSAQYDFEMELGGITAQFAQEVNMLAPFGPGNLQPVVLSKGVRLANLERIGKEAKHLRCHITKSEQYIGAVYFNAGDLFGEINDLDRADIIYTPEINNFMGRSSLQLTIKNLAGAKPGDEQAWIGRNQDKFIGALSSNIMYNSSRVPCAPKTDEKGELLKKALVDSSLGTVAVCFTPNGAERLCAFLSENDLWGRADVRLGTLNKSLCAYNAILLAPKLEGLDISRYSRVVIFGGAPSTGIVAQIESLAPNAEIWLTKPEKGELTELISQLPCTRERLIELYKALRGTLGRFYNRPAMEEALCLAARCQRWEAYLAGEIFYELGFVKKGERGLVMEQNPPKRALEESPMYFTINSLGNLNDMYLYFYEEAQNEA